MAPETSLFSFLVKFFGYSVTLHMKWQPILVSSSLSNHVLCLVTQILCNPMDCSPPGILFTGILQARILEWVVMPSSRGPSQPNSQTQVSHTAGGLFTVWVTREAQEYWSGWPIPSPGDLLNPGIEPGSLELQVDSLPAELPRKPSSNHSTATVKSLQSCPTLCDPIDSSLPGSPVPGILQARTLEWVAISFSNAWKWKGKVRSLSLTP